MVTSCGFTDWVILNGNGGCEWYQPHSESQPKLFALSEGRQIAGAWSTFIKWTEWILVAAFSHISISTSFSAAVRTVHYQLSSSVKLMYSSIGPHMPNITSHQWVNYCVNSGGTGLPSMSRCFAYTLPLEDRAIYGIDAEFYSSCKASSILAVTYADNIVTYHCSKCKPLLNRYCIKLNFVYLLTTLAQPPPVHLVPL